MRRSGRWFAGFAAMAVALSGVPASVAAEDALAAACADAPQGRFGDVAGVHEAGIDCIGWWGVTQGTGDGSYLPGEPVNRAQMATFVASAIELSGGELPEEPPAAFTDTTGNVHAPNIDALAALEVVGGVGDGRYAPDREVTRAQMATFLAGAWEARTGQELPPGAADFTDIEGNVHAEVITAITAVGWTGGTAPGIYEPSGVVTRAQMGTFLARWLTTLVEDDHATYPPANPIPLPEPDPEPDPGEQAPTPPVTQGGTVVFGDGQEPTSLNSFLIEGNSLVTSKVTANVWPGMFRLNPSYEFDLYLLAEEPEFTEDPFELTYVLRDDAEWSDGTPITVEDVEFTLSVYDEDADWAGQLTSRAGYELIENVETDGDHTITMTFSEPYAPWQLLFSEILPAHVLEGEDFGTVLNDELPEVSGGPFIFDSWDRGTQLRLVRNDNYWNGDVALDDVIMRYLPTTDALTDQLLAGEIDMYDPRPSAELAQRLRADASIEVDAGQGPVWEHATINTLVPGLDQTFVRQAIALGFDRQGLVDEAVGDIVPDPVVLDNPFWTANDDRYVPTYGQWDYDPAAAVALLEDNGCEMGGDDVYVCDGVRLSFRVGTTGGNERRELTQQLMQADLAEIGIEITIENAEGAAFFEFLNTPENCDGVCDYDIALFAWVASPNPVGNANIYGCDGFDEGEPTVRPQNWTVFCDEELTDLMDTANATVDPDENADLWNQAASIIADNVPVIPLFQQPQLLAFDNTITGPQLNATTATHFWNSAQWAYQE